MFFRRKKARSETLGKKLAKVRIDDIDQDEEESDILSILEITAKSIKLDVKEIAEFLKSVSDELPHIRELKDEIKELKAELREEKLFNRSLIEKYVEKTPAQQSAADRLAALRAANDASVKPSGLAAVEKAAAKK